MSNGKQSNCPVQRRYGDTSPQGVSGVYVESYKDVVPDIAGQYSCHCKQCGKIFSVYEDLTSTPSKYQWPENCVNGR